MTKVQGESKLTFLEATSIIIGHGSDRSWSNYCLQSLQKTHRNQYDLWKIWKFTVSDTGNSGIACSVCWGGAYSDSLI